MRARSMIVAASVAVVGALAIGTGAVAAGRAGHVPAAPSGTQFVVNMDGSQVPEGDPDGQGRAFLDITPETGVVCFRIVVRNITLPAIDAHIHDGDAGTDGPVVVRLAGPDTSASSRGCTAGWLTPALQDIVDNPQGYYVNVHTADYPGGAIRGQMG